MQRSTELKNLVDQVAATPGWQVEKTTRGWRCLPPDQDAPVVLVGLSGENRALKNTKADLRRAGWDPDAADRARERARRRRLTTAVTAAATTAATDDPNSNPNSQPEGPPMPAARRQATAPTSPARTGPTTATVVINTKPAATVDPTTRDSTITTTVHVPPAMRATTGDTGTGPRWPVPPPLQVVDTREMDDPEHEIPQLLKARQEAAGIITELWWITPLAALVLHGYRDAVNDDGYRHRAVTAAQVKKYRADISGEQWKLTHQGLAFNRQGQLSDGQHRMEALTDAETDAGAAPFMITFNLEPDTMPVLDTGRSRTGGDVLTAGGMASGSALAAAVRLVDLYLSTHPHVGWSKVPYPPHRIYTLAQDYVGLDQAIRDSAPIRKIGASPSAAAAFIYLVRREWPGADEAAPGSPSLLDQFIEGVATGYGLEPGDARGALRNYAINSSRRARQAMGIDSASRNRTVRREQAEWLAILLRAWAGWLTNKRVNTLSWKPAKEEMPGICNPLKPAKEWQHRRATLPTETDK